MCSLSTKRRLERQCCITDPSKANIISDCILQKLHDRLPVRVEDCDRRHGDRREGTRARGSYGAPGSLAAQIRCWWGRESDHRRVCHVCGCVRASMRMFDQAECSFLQRRIRPQAPLCSMLLHEQHVTKARLNEELFHVVLSCMCAAQYDCRHSFARRFPLC